MNNMTLIQAQQRYIDRAMSCHTGHVRRVSFDMACKRIANAMAQGTLLDPTPAGEQQALEL